VDSQTLYNYFFVLGGTFTAIWLVFKFGVHKAIETHMDEIRTELKPIAEMDRRMMRVEYALYNDGKTGLINKVDCLVENQAHIRTDIEVVKAKVEASKRVRSTK
jgi:hypothetical protein